MKESHANNLTAHNKIISNQEVSRNINPRYIFGALKKKKLFQRSIFKL